MRQTSEGRFPAMGTTAHVIVVGPTCEELVARALCRVIELESLWSRFIDFTDIARLNRANGEATEVSTETLDLVAHGVAAWRLTNGVFDPTMEVQLSNLGYDRPFSQLDGHEPIEGQPLPSAGSVGCGDIVVDRQRQEVTLPAGVGFDAGGYGKGFAADLVTDELIELGAMGVLVSIGGDLAVKGVPPEGNEWVVTIREASVSADDLATVRLIDAGLATSTSAKRRWATSSGDRHHILDPRTGESATSCAVLASVIAGSAWWAEVQATSLIVDDEQSGFDDASLLVMVDGGFERLGAFERFEQ